MHGKRLVGIVLAIASLSLLLVAASTAGTSAKRGGTIVLDMTTDVDYIDPQLSYYGETWKLEAATACKLMNWPDKEGAAGAVATPEVAQGLPLVSKDGKTYTFTIRKGFRFSNGKPVTAQPAPAPPGPPPAPTASSPPAAGFSSRKSGETSRTPGRMPLSFLAPGKVLIISKAWRSHRCRAELLHVELLGSR